MSTRLCYSKKKCDDTGYGPDYTDKYAGIFPIFEKQKEMEEKEKNDKWYHCHDGHCHKHPYTDPHHTHGDDRKKSGDWHRHHHDDDHHHDDYGYGGYGGGYW